MEIKHNKNEDKIKSNRKITQNKMLKNYSDGEIEEEEKDNSHKYDDESSDFEKPIGLKRPLKSEIEEEENYDEEINEEKDLENEDEESEDEEDEEDEDDELLREYEKIKKMREEEKKMKDMENSDKLKKQAEEQLLMGNPLVNVSGYSLKRKWYEDTVFKNQSKNEPKTLKRFVNDTVRSDFHRKFLSKCMQ